MQKWFICNYEIHKIASFTTYSVASQNPSSPKQLLNVLTINPICCEGTNCGKRATFLVTAGTFVMRLSIIHSSTFSFQSQASCQS